MKMRSVASTLCKYLQGRREGQSKRQNVEKSRDQPQPQKRLGDYPRKVFRSLPPLESCTSEIPLATFPGPCQSSARICYDTPLLCWVSSPCQRREGLGEKGGFLSAPVPSPGLHSGALGPERGSFLQLLRRQAVPGARGREPGFHSSRVQGSWAGSV